MAEKQEKKKYGGRKKGTPNKRTLILADALEKKNLDPIAGLHDCLQELEEMVVYEDGAKISLVKAKADIYMELLQYLYPKRKAIQVEEPVDPNLDRPLKDLTDEELDEL